MTNSGNPSFWESFYQENHTPWNIGYPNPLWLSYVNHFSKDMPILFPGAGHAHEAIALFQQGYRKIFICDWSETIMETVLKREPSFPKTQLLITDFFKLDQQFDLIIEQTFFSALPPSWRGKYARKMHQLLTVDGILAGVLFASPMHKDRPPFGGSEALYRSVFKPYFTINTFEIASNSIPARQGNEFFMELKPIV